MKHRKKLKKKKGKNTTNTSNMNINKSNKKRKEFTMNEFIHKEPSLQVPIIQNPGDADLSNILNKAQASSSIDARIHNIEKDYKERVEYNENLSNIDSDYSSLTPLRDVLVRVSARVHKKNDSLGLLPIDAPKVPVKSMNTKGVWKYVDDFYLFSTTAIVVSANEYSPLKKGDFVHISAECISVIAPQAQNDQLIIPKYGYVHPSKEWDDIPTKPTDKDYGYLLIPEALIITKITDNA